MYLRVLTYPTTALLIPFLRRYHSLQSRLVYSMAVDSASVSSSLEEVKRRISIAVTKRKETSPGSGVHVHDESCVSSSPRLVAASKKQAMERLLEAYECGQRAFGENYVQVWAP